MNYLVTDSELTSIAAAIRGRLGVAVSMSYPDGFINNIHTIDNYPIESYYTSFPDMLGWVANGSIFS